MLWSSQQSTPEHFEERNFSEDYAVDVSCPACSVAISAAESIILRWAL